MNNDFSKWIDEILYKKLHHNYRMLVLDIKHSSKILIEQIKNSKVLLKFWKLPHAIQEYDYAMGNAHFHKDRLEKMIEDRDNTIAYLIKKLAHERITAQTSDAEKAEIYKNIYENIEVENVYGDLAFEVPTKYLSEEEAEDRLDRNYERSREAMCGCYDTSWDEAEAVISDLQDDGFYSGVNGPEDHWLNPNYKEPKLNTNIDWSRDA